MTRDELEAMSDLSLAIKILQDRLDHIYNPYTPLALKIRRAIDSLKESDAEEQLPPNRWFITFTDAAGKTLDIQRIPFDELKQIGMAVEIGFSSGNIICGENRNGGISMMVHRPKTETVSTGFRLDKELYEQSRAVCRDLGISLNYVIQVFLKKYLCSGRVLFNIKIQSPDENMNDKPPCNPLVG